MPQSIRYPVRSAIFNRWRLLVYPQLRGIPEREQGSVLRAARGAELDLLERIGVLFGLVATTAALQPIGADWASALTRHLAQFALALPLLCCVAGPFLLRRTRRGLEIERRKRGER